MKTTPLILIPFYIINKILRFVLLLSFCVISSIGLAQVEHATKGVVIDVGTKKSLDHATISLLSSKDSTLQQFTYTLENGTFHFNMIPYGSYFILVELKNYADYTEQIIIDSNHTYYNLGVIGLQLKSHLLQEVIIKDKAKAIKIIGDTTEFNPKAYIIRPNDKVEDILKQLPGMEVDNNGKITIYGKKIVNVLVDGEEFFGDDPTLVTQNIRADMVSKIQLYDKKSDQATFTGIDDGQKTKTLNIKLKEDKKNGLFGKINLSGGSDGYYDEQAIFNKFTSKEKIAAYLTIADDGKTGLKYSENNSIGAAGNVHITEGGLITITGDNSGLDSFNGTYDKRGIPVVKSGGAHFDSKLNDRESININYKIGSIDVTGLSTSVSQLTLPNEALISNSRQQYDNYSYRQRFDMTYQIKLDSMSTLKFSIDGTYKNFKVQNNFISSEDANDLIVNSATRNVLNNGSQKDLNFSGFYSKKYKKNRRTLAWSLSGSSSFNDAKGSLESSVQYFNKSGLKDSTQNINQYKVFGATQISLNSNVSYTEPLSKRFSLIINYGLGIINSSADRKTLIPSSTNSYGVLDSNYSNNYEFNQFINQIGTTINYKKNTVIINIGNKASNVRFQQNDLYRNSISRRNFTTFNPQASFQYKGSQDKSLTFSYEGRSTEPTIDQIQPVIVNTDPLDLIMGNPNLNPSFTNRFNFNYDVYHELSGESFDFSGYYVFTNNDIIFETNTNLITGQTTNSFLNLNKRNTQRYYFRGDYIKRISSIDANLSVGLNTNGNTTYNYLNGQLIQLKDLTYAFSAGFNKYVANTFSFSTTAGPTYSVNNFSMSSSNNNAFGLKANVNGVIYLPFKFQFSPALDYTFTAATDAFKAEKIAVINLTFSKTFLKSNKLKAAIFVNDLLNQYTNFRRSIYGNYITQNNTTAVGRYLMFSLSYDFTKFKMTSENK